MSIVFAMASCGGQKNATTPQITRITTVPSPPVAPLVRFTIEGNSFDEGTLKVVVTGKGCESGCGIPTSALNVRTATVIAGVADLRDGTFLFTVKNGSGPASNAFPVTLLPAAQSSESQKKK
jgi:hypothetical protein